MPTYCELANGLIMKYHMAIPVVKNVPYNLSDDFQYIGLGTIHSYTSTTSDTHKAYPVEVPLSYRQKFRFYRTKKRVPEHLRRDHAEMIR